jgi:hypothetical protein
VRKRLGLLRRIRNLIRLGIPPSHQRFFLERYFGSSPLKNSWFFWYRLNKIWYTASIGLKKMLRLKKLSRKLGMG